MTDSLSGPSGGVAMRTYHSDITLMLNVKETPADRGTDVTAPRLEIDRVSKRYGDVVALSDMTFDVRAGEIFGFVGSNGAGKTTTMRIALGVLAADAGEVRWDGAPVDAADAPADRLHAGGARPLPADEGRPSSSIYLARLHGMSRGRRRRAAGRRVDRAARRRRPARRRGAEAQPRQPAARAARRRAGARPATSWCWTSRSPASTRSRST